MVPKAKYKTPNELRRKEALCLAALEALDEGACLYERLPIRSDGLRDYRYIWMNSAMQRMFGIADLSGQSIRDNFPDEVESWYDDYDRVLETGTPIRIVRESEPQGMFIEMSVTRVDAAGDAVLLAVMRNVTARVTAENALSRSEQRLRNVLDGMDEAFGLMDPEFRILTQNKAALELDGRPIEDIVGRTHWEVYPGTEDSEIGQLYRDAIAKQTPISLEHRYDWPGGGTSWLDMRAYPVPEGLAVFWSDITEHKEADQALRDSEQRFRALVTATSDIIFRMDASWTELRHLEGRGVLRNVFEPTKNWLHTYIEESDQARVLAAIKSAIDAKAVFELEHRARRPDGTLGWVVSRAIPILKDSGEIIEWFGTVSDVTERHLALEALSRNQRLETVARLSGTLAHDFNNLLLVVMANIEMAGLQALSSEQKDYLDAAGRLVEMGGKLSKRLMGWANQNESTAQDLELNRLVSDMIPNLDRTLAHGHDLCFSASVEPAMIHADPMDIDAAVMNLVMNSRDATPEGGQIAVSIDVLPMSGRSCRYVCLSVSDTGFGMTEEIRGRAAEPFFTTKAEGTGLGLYSVRETARNVGGFLEIESTENNGTTVRMFVPLVDHISE